MSEGLSPQVWGNRRRIGRDVGQHGSIPTGMGEPAACAKPSAISRVYPHRYGGTAQEEHQPMPGAGLSPQVWGNRSLSVSSNISEGSIPTGMGEPTNHRATHKCAEVYPHRYGGTILESSWIESAEGLSPQVWGNLVDRHLALAGCRSIPTGMGEPGSSSLLSAYSKVYPHRYGGTPVMSTIPARRLGLSPQVWGNPSTATLSKATLGSIPTGMGEPRAYHNPPLRNKVYPHRYGGTQGNNPHVHIIWGLSPQVWGNHSRPSSRNL